MAEQGPMSGLRDMLPEQMIPRNEMLSTIQKVYEGYGFSPIQTPILERAETMAGKYGEEGDKLMYRFRDHGDRDVAMRYDMTVPLARLIGQHGGKLPLPFKRYVAGSVFRGERPQAGRYREFTQFDADIVGVKSPMADAEMVAMISDSMAAFGASALIRVNDRCILDGLIQAAGITDEPVMRKFIATIDKLDKIGLDTVLGEIRGTNGDAAAELVRQYLSIGGTATERLDAIAGLLQQSDAAAEGIANTRAVFALLEGSGYGMDKVLFDPTIARGLDYYTGIIYETNLQGAEDLGSVCSGGRYDHLVHKLGGPEMAAVGISIGVDRLYDALKRLELLHEAKTPTRVLVVNFEADRGPDYMRLARDLRQAGIATEVFYEPAKLVKQFKYANRQGIPHIIVIGPAEREAGVAKVRAMVSGTETEVPLENLVRFIEGAAV